MNTDTEILDLLPARLKEARRSQGLSLDAVAKLSGVSRSMVSQIERGESSPTIATLWNLTRALQVDFAGLLDRQDLTDRVEVLRAATVPTIENRGEGCNIRILSAPEDAGKHELYDLEFLPNGKLISGPHGRGTREHLTVIEGRVKVTLAPPPKSSARGIRRAIKPMWIMPSRPSDPRALCWLCNPLKPRHA